MWARRFVDPLLAGLAAPWVAPIPPHAALATLPVPVLGAAPAPEPEPPTPPPAPGCPCGVPHGPEHARHCAGCGLHELRMAFWRGQWWCLAHFPERGR